MGEIVGRLGSPAEPDEELPAPGALQPDARGARWLRRRAAASVAAVSTVLYGDFRVTTVAPAMVVSEEPLLVLITLETEGQFAEWLRDSNIFGVSFLSWRDQLLADRFAGLAPRVSPRLEGVPFVTAVTGSPLIASALAWADCEVIDIVATGDHLCFVGKAVAVGAGSGDEAEPLIYYLNGYRRP